MNHRLFLLLLSLTVLPLATACNLGPGDDDDAPGDDDDDVDPIDVSITDLTSGLVESGLPVVVSGGVITTPFLTSHNEEDTEAQFWIQDGSGPGTGMLVFTYRDIIESIEDSVGVGDVVTISGTYEVPFGSFGEVRLTVASDLQVTGTRELPEAHVVDAVEIAAGFGDASLEGIILAVEHLTVDEDGGWDNYFDWTTTQGVLINSDFYYADVLEGYEVDRLTGVFAESFGDKMIHPRWASDVEYIHPGCDASSADNIVALNCGGIEEDGDVSATLVVTSPAPFYGDAFFAQSLDASEYGGIQVYGIGDITVPAIGTVVTVSGEYEEYKGQSEIIVFSADDITVDDGTPTVEIVPTSVDSACDLGEAHEGRIVAVASVAVTQDSDGANYGYYEVEGCPHIRVDGTFFTSNEDFQSATGGPGTITNLTGIVIDEYDTFAIAPRDTNDWDSWAE